MTLNPLSQPIQPRDEVWAERRAKRLNRKRDKTLPLFVGTPALEALAPTVTTEQMLAWDVRHTEALNRFWSERERGIVRDYQDHRAIVLAYGGATLAELHELYCVRVYGAWPNKAEYHSSHYITLCRAMDWPNAFGDQQPSDEVRANLVAGVRRNVDFVLRFIVGKRPEGKAVFEELDDEEIQERIAQRKAEREARRQEVGPYLDSAGQMWTVYLVPPAPGATSVQYDFVYRQVTRTLDEWQIERDHGAGNWRAACARFDNMDHGRPSKKNSAASNASRRRRQAGRVG